MSAADPETPQQERGQKTPRRRRRLPWRKRHSYVFGMLVFAAFTVFVVPVVLVLLAGRPIDAPAFLTQRIERILNRSLAGGAMTLGAVDVILTTDWQPQIRIESLEFADQTSLPIADFQNLRVTLSRAELLRGQVAPLEITVDGAFMSLRREPDGRFDLALEPGAAPQAVPSDAGLPLGSAGSLADILDSIDFVFQAPELASIRMMRAQEVTFQYEDARAARFWVATGGALEVTQDPEKVELRLGFQLLYGEDTPAQAALSFTAFKGSRAASLAANIIGLPASDFSSQAPALAWLSVIDAPVSGAIRAEIDDAGILASTEGTLDIGAGFLQPTEDTRAIGFGGGRAYFGYDPTNQRVRFDELSVTTDIGRFSADGQAFLQDIDNGWPRTMIGQLRLAAATLNPQGVLETPLELSGGAVDLRLQLEPFLLTIGQAAIMTGDSHIRADGEIAARPGGWDVALNFGLDALAKDQLVAAWPKDIVPNTRRWIAQNVLEGVFRELRGGFRHQPGAAPVLNAQFAFDDARVRFMKQMPPIEGGRGYATISDNRFVLVAEAGAAPFGQAGALDVAGTVLSIDDVRLQPPDMIVDLRAEGEVSAALALLNHPPFEFLDKAGLDADLAEGQARVQGEILVPLRRALLAQDVGFDLQASVQNVRSDRLVPGKWLVAEQLTVDADSARVRVSGSGHVNRTGDMGSGVGFTGSWVQPIGEGSADSGAQVEAQLALSQTFLEEFGIALPEGSVSGEGVALLEIALAREEAPRFRLVSDLNRITMRIAEIGWRKAANVIGLLEVSGRLGASVSIDDLRLEGAGLRARGAVTLNADNSFARADFSRVTVGEWLDAPVSFIARGAGANPAVAVTGGTIDIRHTTFGQGGSGGAPGGAGSADTPITLALDRLRVTDSISLHNMRADLRTRPGLNGQFNASINGAAPVAGTLAPTPEGTAVRIRSDDAGAVMRAAGVFSKLYDGSLDLTLVPRPENGQYNGRLTAQNVKVRGAPALADLLGAISVIGLLEQLDGQGLLFTQLESRFVLTPTHVHLTQGSAIGASLGVSMEGIYELAQSRLDMRGVISPIYVVNGIGAILTRRGEGLFGFNYRLGGTANDPQVRVNPLSILTPGMFRELFRGPAPRVRGGENGGGGNAGNN